MSLPIRFSRPEGPHSAPGDRFIADPSDKRKEDKSLVS